MDAITIQTMGITTIQITDIVMEMIIAGGL